MSQHHSRLPGALLLRDALRIVRHVAREGRDVVQYRTSKVGSPIGEIAGVAIAQADRLAHGAEEVAHFMLGESDEVFLPSSALKKGTINASVFAHAAYVALGHILRNLGAHSWLVSEAKLARAFELVCGTNNVEGATKLIIYMQKNSVIADLRMEPEIPLNVREAADLAYFGLMLWMLTDKSASDAQEVLDAATALSLALREDILAAQSDPTAIAILLREFRDHV